MGIGRGCAVAQRRVVTVTQQIDLSGPLGRMVASLLLGIGEMEREHLRERQAAEDRTEVLAFQKKVARLQRAVRGAVKAAEEAETRLDYVRKALLDTPAANPDLFAEAQALKQRLNQLLTKLRGDRTREKRQEPAAPSIDQRVQQVVGQWNATSAPTQTQRDAYRHAGEEFAEALAGLRVLIEEDLARFEEKLEAAGAPWTPGRIPDWEME